MHIYRPQSPISRETSVTTSASRGRRPFVGQPITPKPSNPRDGLAQAPRPPTGSWRPQFPPGLLRSRGAQPLVHACRSRGLFPLTGAQGEGAAGLWPLSTPVSPSAQSWSAESAAILASFLRPRTGPSSACAERLSSSASHFSVVPQICVLEALLIFKGRTQENVNMAVWPRRIRRKVRIY